MFQNLDHAYLEQLEQEMPKERTMYWRLAIPLIVISNSIQRALTKVQALRTLADHLSIPMNETIAIGDNINDLAMIREAELGIAVANAVPTIKEAQQIQQLRIMNKALWLKSSKPLFYNL